MFVGHHAATAALAFLPAAWLVKIASAGPHATVEV